MKWKQFSLNNYRPPRAETKLQTLVIQQIFHFQCFLLVNFRSNGLMESMKAGKFLLNQAETCLASELLQLDGTSSIMEEEGGSLSMFKNLRSDASQST